MAGVALALKDDCIPERHRRKIELTDKTAQVVAEETRSPSSLKKGEKNLLNKKKPMDRWSNLTLALGCCTEGEEERGECWEWMQHFKNSHQR